MIFENVADVVQRFVDTHDIGQVVEIQKSILELYRQDIWKDIRNCPLEIKNKDCLLVYQQPESCKIR